MIPKPLKKKMVLMKNKGSNYQCPFCSFNAKDLCLIGLDFPVLKEKQIVGGGLRKGGCYKCGSSDRERLIYTFLDKEFDLFNKKKEFKILHIAPEKNVSQKLLTHSFSNYICGDLFTEGYQYPDHVQNINVLDIPFESDYFDLVICNHVLEHIPDDEKAMKELNRVLKPNAQAILQVPISKNTAATFEDFSITDPHQRELVFGQFDHIRIYGQDYPNRLNNCGFKVDRINLHNKYKHVGINPDEDLFICTKTAQ